MEVPLRSLLSAVRCGRFRNFNMNTALLAALRRRGPPIDCGLGAQAGSRRDFHDHHLRLSTYSHYEP